MCDGCPKQEERKAFQEAAEGYLDERLGDKWKRYGFDNLVEQVLDVLDVERASVSNLSLTTKTRKLLDIVENERRRMKRIDEWNARQKQTGGEM